MKTTVEIPDSLLEDARRLAARQQTTLRVLIIEGLRRVVAERKRGGAFKLRDATFGGSGLQSDAVGADWERIRGWIYEKQGG